MSFLNKRVEDSIKQAKLLAQMSELSYRALNGTRQTRSNFINNDLKEQADTDKPAVGSLTSEMIAQYKREEEEKNKYVDPKSGDEFLYAPTGITPTIATPSLVDVSSLGAPATITDVETEQNKYARILNLLAKQKQAIQEKEEEITKLETDLAHVTDQAVKSAENTVELTEKLTKQLNDANNQITRMKDEQTKKGAKFN
jgi:hypothetical protein